MTVVEKALKTYVWHFKHQNTCYIKGAKAKKKEKKKKYMLVANH